MNDIHVTECIDQTVQMLFQEVIFLEQKLVYSHKANVVL